MWDVYRMTTRIRGSAGGVNPRNTGPVTPRTCFQRIQAHPPRARCYRATEQRGVRLCWIQSRIRAGSADPVYSVRNPSNQLIGSAVERSLVSGYLTASLQRTFGVGIGAVHSVQPPHDQVRICIGWMLGQFVAQ